VALTHLNIYLDTFFWGIVQMAIPFWFFSFFFHFLKKYPKIKYIIRVFLGGLYMKNYNFLCVYFREGETKYIYIKKKEKKKKRRRIKSSYPKWERHYILWIRSGKRDHFNLHKVIIFICVFFFFFWHVHTRWGIRTSDIRFMRCSIQPIELPLIKYVFWEGDN
jgi:hypothetical protein